MVDVVMIVAVADNGVIGTDDALPWHLPEDLKRFKAMTMGAPVVMGRRTWDSLPRKPLPGRANLVVTREPGFAGEGTVPAASLEEAYTKARHLAEDAGKDALYLIGGASLYEQALALEGAHGLDRIEMTEVRLAPDGDVSLPAIDREIWHETAREKHVAENGIAFEYVTLKRHHDASD